ncbi:hypothetical protein LPJ53_003352 [Coemansia erecta]|uniref:Uncharacterized protein n=1 Tax=Coemansia erecta TaxID=147472 RepID=A0A9W7XWF7_9FUNG|nr:hypothetical protein LPJ53_003352 [Coemansia erecta]
MLSSGLISFLLYLVIPVVLVSFFRGRKTNDQGQRAHKKYFSLGDVTTYATLALLASFYMYAASYNRPANVFRQISIHPQSSCAVLRQRLAQYAARHPDIAPADGIPSQHDKANSAFDRRAYYKDSEYGHMDFLVDRFCAFDEDRDVYLKFGETVFMESISSDFGPRGTSARIAMPDGGSANDLVAKFPDIGFLLAAASGLFFTYLPAFVLIGLLTTPFFITEFAPSRANVRPLGVIALCIMLTTDMYWLFTVPTSLKTRVASKLSLWIVSPESSSALLFYADSADYTRKVFLGAALIGFMVLDFLMSPRETDVQILKRGISEQQNVLNDIKNMSILDTSVMMSDRLRERVIAMWKREQNARAKVFEDTDFEAKYEKVAQDTKSKAWVRQTLSEVVTNKFGISQSS